MHEVRAASSQQPPSLDERTPGPSTRRRRAASVGDPAGLLRARHAGLRWGRRPRRKRRCVHWYCMLVEHGRYQRAIPEPRAGAEAARAAGVDMHAALLSAGPVDVPSVGVRIQGRPVHHDVGTACDVGTARRRVLILGEVVLCPGGCLLNLALMRCGQYCA
jgi:hypothetical protein